MRKLFLVQLAGGLLILAWGLLVVPILPYVQLDVVLTPEQLRDQALKQQTLTMLQQIERHDMIWAAAAGLFVVVTSAIGLRLNWPVCVGDSPKVKRKKSAGTKSANGRRQS